jgi:hypothetical protein
MPLVAYIRANYALVERLEKKPIRRAKNREKV